MSLDTISGVPECIESVAGSTLDTRLDVALAYSVHHRSENARWGPQDVVVLEKQRVTLNPFQNFFGSNSFHYVHFPRGADVSSAGAMSAYLYTLTTNAESAPWLSASSFKIKKGTFCTFCAVSGIDVRVEMEIPGRTQAFGIRVLDGEHVEVTEQLFREAALCSAIRSHCCVPTSQPCVRFIYRSVDWIATIRAFPTSREAGVSVFRHLMSFSRVEDADIIKQLCNLSDDDVLSHDVMNVLTLGSRKQKWPASSASSSNVAAEASGVVDTSDVQRAEVFLDRARKHVLKSPSDPTGWLELAAAYRELGAYESALVTLNIVQMEDPAETVDPEYEIPPPSKLGGVASVKYESRTKPKSGASPVPAWYYEDNLAKAADLNAMKGVFEDGSNDDDDDDDLDIDDGDDDSALGGGGSGGADSGSRSAGKNGAIDRELQMLPGRLLYENTLVRQAYDILVSMWNDLSWDGLLKVRGQVFYTHEESSEDDASDEDGIGGSGPQDDDLPAVVHDEPVGELIESPSVQIEALHEHDFGRNDAKANISTPKKGQNEKLDDNLSTSEDSGDAAAAERPEQVENGTEESNRLEKLTLMDPSSSQNSHSGGFKDDANRKPIVERDTTASLVDDPSASHVVGGEFDEAASKSSPVALARDSAFAKKLRVRQKRLCAAWLDSLFRSLYKDLVQYSAWQEEEEMVSKKFSGRDVYDNFPPRPPSEWFLRGALAERLQRFSDAEMAYRLSVYRGWYLRSFLALLRFYSDSGILVEGVIVADQILKYYDPPATVQRVNEEVVHPKIRKAVFRLISYHGLIAVQEACSRSVPEPHPFWTQIFMTAVKHHTYGFDKR
eukprot:ANDGO_07118.mRNA.1 Chs5p-Arf1p-binding protein (ChAPs)